MNELRDKEEQYSVFLKYKSPKEQKNGFTHSLLSTFCVVCIGFICAFIFYNLILDHPRVNMEETKPTTFWDSFQHKEKKGFNIPLFTKKQNILLLGVDSNGENSDLFKGTRSDTILLVNLNPKSHSVNIISIPRDSKVYLADGSGIQKINHAHALGGIDLTKKTIEKTLGVEIDRYIIVNAEGIRKFVDTIGGVPVYVEKPLKYHDYTGKLHIDLAAGNHVLNGREAEGFLRFRHDGLGDIGRTSRQQWFLTSLINRLKAPDMIAKIPEALKLADEYIKTDMTLYELSHLAAFSRNIDLDSIEVATLPGQPSTKGYISYWILDPDKTQDVVDRLIYRETVNTLEEPLTVGIMYSVEKEEMANKLREEIEALGYEVNCVGRGKVPHSQIIAHKKEVSTALISRIKRKIPELKGMQFVYDPNRNYCIQSDFTIIISND